ncbi:MAG: hypothetical protein EOM91_15515 [Sphingobacteriia bacterium]|nr:hypothetical protein [Sphingobacteriia bacterium]
MTESARWLADNPMEALFELRAAEREGRAPAREVTAWLSGGIADFIDGYGRLDELLGLTSPGRGRPTPLSTWRARQQNAALSEALAECGGDLRALSKSVHRFESGAWLRWRDRDAPPPSATATEAALFRALKIGRVPTSPEQLGRRLRAVDSSGGV